MSWQRVVQDMSIQSDFQWIRRINYWWFRMGKGSERGDRRGGRRMLMSRICRTACVSVSHPPNNGLSCSIQQLSGERQPLDVNPQWRSICEPSTRRHKSSSCDPTVSACVSQDNWQQGKRTYSWLNSATRN